MADPYFFGKKDFFHVKRTNKAENFESSVNGLYKYFLIFEEFP